ncbi:maltokinase N-terminal cap-like domain-containing protein [Auritidibacter ignavus]|uniref:maltokinase N-terminal cap-like domain-containing protein n=1 Tax=Auritidibacter ignavus TaxID=678932 RepID=UPI002448CF88|nr:hypothetical protein [Auritidibacter ignavus]WGH86752.1 hypothetical protein QDX24_02800 [Auritidibacter ignavus]WGH89038.1 hypothetical protein QDX22_02795 [Auritidibacter ignavus]
MATVYLAETEPDRNSILSDWVASQYWGSDEDIEIVGSYHFDDTEGSIMLEGFILHQGERFLHVPVTYRLKPLAGADSYLVAEMEHPAVGHLWIYDALADPVAVHLLNLAIAGEIQQAVPYFYNADGQYLGSEESNITLIVRGEVPEPWGQVGAHHVLLLDQTESTTRRIVAMWDSGQSTIYELLAPQPTSDETTTPEETGSID